MRILLVEDDEQLGEATQKGLSLDGHHVDWVKDGETAESVIKTEAFDLVVLDLGLPKQPGLHVLRRSRQDGIKTPVIILTARDTVDDRVRGLDSGADDYMVKPFDLDELCARVRALQRRSSGRAEPNIVYGDLVLYPASHTVTYKGDAMNIPRREFALLEKLLENQGRVLSREYLSQMLYGFGDEVDSNALEVHIHNLRKKLGQDFIITFRGVGYMVGTKNNDDNLKK